MNRTLVRHLGLTAAGAAIALAPFFSIAADTVNQKNKDTGSNSTNRNRSRIERRLTETQTNTGSVGNVATGVSNTGGNTANKNTGDGKADSGKAKINGTLATTLNQSVTPLSATPPGDVTVDQTNEDTGSNSTNRNRFVLDDRTTMTQTNTASVGNVITGVADTGDNSANQNTGNGTAQSGDAEVTFTVTTTAN